MGCFQDIWCYHFNLKDEKTSYFNIKEFNNNNYSTEKFSKDCEIKEIVENNNLNEK